ncbi:hypothetical protein Tco_0532449 [Tanacetum coccineum]
MFESGSYRSYPEHATLYNALEVSMDCENREEFIEAIAKSHKRRRNDQDPPTPPPKESDQSKNKRQDSNASALKQPQAQTSSAWKTTDTREAPSSFSKADWLKPIPEEEMPETPKPEWVIPPNELLETENNWADALAKTYKDPEENKLLRKTRDMSSFIKWYCKQIGKSKLIKADLEGPAYKLVKPFHKNSISLQYQMEECHFLLMDQIDLVTPKGNRVVPDVSKTLPLGGPLGDKERRFALSISKLKAAYYLDFGLKEFVPSLWIESKHDYDISAAYGISHWWFKHKEFYITRHSAPFNHRAVRSHMRILSVISLKTFSRYGYTFLKEIVLCRANYQEYKISEADFKNLHPNDFEDMYLLHLQGKLNYLSGSDKVHLFNAVNLWIRNIVIRHRMEDDVLSCRVSYLIIKF